MAAHLDLFDKEAWSKCGMPRPRLPMSHEHEGEEERVDELTDQNNKEP